MTHIDDPQTQKANMSFIRDAMNAPMLEKDHERALIARWLEDKDEKALHQLINAHTRLAISMASKFKNYGLPLGDLIQEGNIGLMQAAERFDLSHDVRFSTYASWWIRASIQDYILRNWSIVRTGTTAAQKSLFFNLRKLRAQIEAQNEREGLSDDDRKKIATKLKVKTKDVADMEGRISGGDQSLNATINNEDGADEWQSFLSDDAPNPEEIVTSIKDAKTRSEWINNALSELSDREQKIIRERHLGYETVTLEALGEDLGISKERVRQLEKRAMGRLKDSIQSYVDNPEDLLFQLAS